MIYFQIQAYFIFRYFYNAVYSKNTACSVIIYQSMNYKMQHCLLKILTVTNSNISASRSPYMDFFIYLCCISCLRQYCRKTRLSFFMKFAQTSQNSYYEYVL